MAQILLGVVTAAASPGEPAIQRVKSLPAPLAQGWEVTDEDPPEGVAGLQRVTWRAADPVREPGPRGAARWYRVRIDLSAWRGPALAFTVAGIRDADEAYLDGVRVGGLGSFPPSFDLANRHFRLYPLPVDQAGLPGVRTLALRVYQGPRASPVFRGPPAVEGLEAALRARSRLDQGLVLLIGVAFTTATIFFVFYLQARDEFEFAAFAGFVALLALYIASFHSVWTFSHVPGVLPFRLGLFAAGLLPIGYLHGMCQVVGVRVPWRYRLYDGAFALFALAAVLVPDARLLVTPSRLFQLGLVASLVDLVAPLVRALRAGRPHALPLLWGHGFFLVGAVLFIEFLPSNIGGQSLWVTALIAVGFLLNAGAFLMVMSDRTGAFRVAAATDAATQLWNRGTLFGHLARRAESARRGGPGFGLVLLELDRFKELNDTRGHPEGDRVLLLVARTLQAVSRGPEIVARYGGDELPRVFPQARGAHVRTGSDGIPRPGERPCSGRVP